MTLKTHPKTTLAFVLSRKEQAFLFRTTYIIIIALSGWLSFENLILLIELESHYANMFLPGITSAPEVKFVHGFSTMPQKLLLLVDLAMIRGTSYLVLL